MKDKQKYLIYEFDLARCEGRQALGAHLIHLWPWP